MDNPFLQELEAAKSKGGGENPFLQEISKPKKEKDPWYEDFGEGLAVSGMGTYYGAKDLLGMMDEEDKATLKDWKDDAAESGWGTAGRVVGEVGQLAAPGGLLGKSAKAASWLKNLSRLKKAGALIAGEGALGGAYGGLRLPEEGESRLKNAAVESGLNVGGLGLAKTLGAGAKGFAKSEAGKNLLKKGVELSASQKARGIPEAAEELLSIFPITSRPVKEMKEAGEAGWANTVLNKANPTGAKEIEGIGADAFKQLKNNVKQGYDEAWSKVDKVASEKEMTGLQNKILSLEGDLTADEFTPLKRVFKEIEAHKASPDKSSFRALDRKVGKELENVSKGAPSSGKMLVTDALTDVKESLRSTLNTEAKDALKVMDSNYRKFLIAQDAADKAAGAEVEGLITPNMLNASLKKFNSRGQPGSGTADMYDIMRLGKDTVGKPKLGGVLGKMQRVMQQIPAPTTRITKGILDTTTGDTAIQRGGLRAINSPLGTALRRTPVTLNDEEY